MQKASFNIDTKTFLAHDSPQSRLLRMRMGKLVCRSSDAFAGLPIQSIRCAQSMPHTSPPALCQRGDLNHSSELTRSSNRVKIKAFNSCCRQSLKFMKQAFRPSLARCLGLTCNTMCPSCAKHFEACRTNNNPNGDP